jgi:hypothetical protein
VGISVSDPRQRDPDFIDHAPPRPRQRSNDLDPIPLARAKDKQDRSAQRKPNETAAHLRPVEGRGLRVQKQPDIFAEAVAKVLQEQLESEFVEAPPVLLNRQSFGIAAKFAAAAGAAALVAMIFVVAFPGSQDPAEENALSALPSWQALKSSLFPAPQREPARTLVVRDGSGPVNEPLSLGASAQPFGASAGAATVPSGPAAPMPQQQQPMAFPGPPAAARAEPPVREINPAEVAGFVKRAQRMLAAGDLQVARLLLLRAAEAHDARGALLLAKTYDPIVSKQFGAAETDSDLVQARNWYQKAEEWGASEARHELDALASYTR